MKKSFSLPALAVAACMTTAFSTPVNPTNIALYAPVTASAYWENNPIVAPEKAVDGSTYDQYGGRELLVLAQRHARVVAGGPGRAPCHRPDQDHQHEQ